MKTIDEYISSFPKEIQARLQQVRSCIADVVPKAVETISYAMPAFKYRSKGLIYFAAFKNHIGLYATPTGHEAFKEELGKYKQGKGSVQFPFDQELPLELISRIAQFRVSEIDKK